VIVYKLAVKHGSRTVTVNVVVAYFVVSSITSPFRVTVYVPI